VTSRTGRRLRRALQDEAGVTLMELVVAMSLMTVVTTVFVTSMIQVYRSVNRTEVNATAQSQIHLTFQRLDREIRYASAIGVPARSDSDWAVAYVSRASGTAVCTRLRLHADAATPEYAQLQRRTWTEGSYATTRTAWVPLASFVSVRAAEGSPPFAADDEGEFQRLRIRLTVQVPGAAVAPANTDVAFAALNAVRGADRTNVCVEGRDDP
jgi:type II secretory pathway pseudopilin PulG